MPVDPRILAAVLQRAQMAQPGVSAPAAVPGGPMPVASTPPGMGPATPMSAPMPMPIHRASMGHKTMMHKR